MAHSQASPTKVQATQRMYDALNMRREGLRYAQIGAALGVSEMSACRYVKKALGRLEKLCGDEAEAQRQLDLDRCDSAINALWPDVEKGKTRSVEVLMQVMKRRADLLGLDKPIKVAPTDPTGDEEYGNSRAELERRLAGLVAAGAATGVSGQPD